MSTAELFSLADRVAVVTGASSGIGNTIARALCSAGAAVVSGGVSALPSRLSTTTRLLPRSAT